MSLDRFRMPLATATTTDTVETAARGMRDRRVGSLVVLREGHPLGIDDLLVLLGAEIAAICEGIENRSDATESR
jgi:hypothetical protein